MVDFKNVARDILVTTPKNQMQNAAEEAQKCIENDGGIYFRRFHKRPNGLVKGSKIYYVEDGYIRGYAIVDDIIVGPMECEVTGEQWPEGVFAIMPAETWTWIEPVEHKGFQGYHYLDYEEQENFQDIGGWKDPKPEVK